MPTVSATLDMCQIAIGCGYEHVAKIKTDKQLDIELSKIVKDGGLWFLEVESAIGSRVDLGRPKSSPIENKIIFQKYYRNR